MLMCVCVFVCALIYVCVQECVRAHPSECYEHDSVKLSLKFHLILFYVLETWIYGAILFYAEIPLHHQKMNLIYLFSFP